MLRLSLYEVKELKSKDEKEHEAITKKADEEKDPNTKEDESTIRKGVETNEAKV